MATTLLNRGRSNAESIARLAGLPRPTANAALLILIQHSLVGSTGGSRRKEPEEEMYEFDTVECLLRLRWGRILALTEQNFGEDVSAVGLSAADIQALLIVRQLLMYGKLSMPEIAKTCGAGDDRQRECVSSCLKLTSGALALRRIVVSLLRHGYLEPTCAELLILRSDQIDRRYRVGDNPAAYADNRRNG